MTQARTPGVGYPLIALTAEDKIKFYACGYIARIGLGFGSEEKARCFGMEVSGCIRVRDAICGHYSKEGGKPPREINLSNVDPENADRNVGGLFQINNTDNRIICPNPYNETLVEINGQGRIQLYGITICSQTTCLVYNVYFHAGADSNKDAMERTNEFLRITKDDIKKQPKGPVLILGDFKCTLSNILEISKDIENLELIDVGSQAEKFGNKKDDYTCLAHGAKTPTRRDYVLANPEAFGLITNFSVDHQAGFDVHSVLKFSMKCDEDYKEVQATKTVKSLVEAKLHMLNERFLKLNRENREQQKNNKEQKMKESAIINIKKLNIGHRDKTRQNKKKQTASDWSSAVLCAKEEAKREKDLNLPDDGSFSENQIDEVDDIIKKVMDKSLNDHKYELQGYIDRKKHQHFI